MTRIVVVPEKLQELSTQFARAGNDLQDLGGRLNSILGTLDWEVRQRAGVEGAVGQARSRAAQLGEQTLEMGRFLALKAGAFSEADSQGAQLVATLPRPVISPAPPMSAIGVGAVFIGSTIISILAIPIIGFVSNLSRKWTATDLMAKKVKDASEALKDVKGLLTQEEWKNLDIDARLKILQKVENALATAKGYPLLQVQRSDLPNESSSTNGVYRGESEPPFIELRNDLLAKDDLHATLTVLAHESQHAYQLHAINNPSSHPNAEQIESWRSNAEHYIEPSQNLKGYWNQPIEYDARHFGDLFADELAPQNAVRELVEEFNEVAGQIGIGG